MEHFIDVGICQFHLIFKVIGTKFIIFIVSVLTSFSFLLSHIYSFFLFFFFLEKSCHRLVQCVRLSEDQLLVLMILLLYVLYFKFFIYFHPLLFLLLNLLWVYFATLFLTYLKKWLAYSFQVFSPKFKDLRL